MPTKSTKIVISEIVLLKQLMKRWRSLKLGRSLTRSSSGLVRPGTLAVYVGPERRRFVIPTRFLNFPVFASLLERAEEELGFQPAGGLALTCEVAFFRWVVDALERDEERFKRVGLDRYLETFADLGLEGSLSGFCTEEADREGFSPLFQKARA